MISCVSLHLLPLLLPALLFLGIVMYPYRSSETIKSVEREREREKERKREREREREKEREKERKRERY